MVADLRRRISAIGLIVDELADRLAADSTESNEPSGSREEATLGSSTSGG